MDILLPVMLHYKILNNSNNVQPNRPQNGTDLTPYPKIIFTYKLPQKFFESFSPTDQQYHSTNQYPKYT